jgi:hypothetical protein
MSLPQYEELLGNMQGLWPKHPDLNPRTRREDAIFAVVATVLDTNNHLVQSVIEDNSVTELVEKANALSGRVSALEEALRVLDNDMHGASNRPCRTCQFVTNLFGQPFGCVSRRIVRGGA